MIRLPKIAARDHQLKSIAQLFRANLGLAIVSKTLISAPQLDCVLISPLRGLFESAIHNREFEPASILFNFDIRATHVIEFAIDAF